MSDNRLVKYGVGRCLVCHRVNLALNKDGKILPHNEGMSWSRRKCHNRIPVITKLYAVQYQSLSHPIPKWHTLHAKDETEAREGVAELYSDVFGNKANVLQCVEKH